ncbi:PqqD family peptide modification chaperone [Methylobacterium brachythecii]|uniref:Hemolysin D n=1 Tax=Methylobacterium brachythecii TaxID=1176177 RepID=A0A7W6AJC2_9HYPH|nr:PqqD family peptide modification chaperone [Methylobacterium brachythecii]MBB3904450.1 putative peptide zinc metalloprotease protein [Methylobacterium brachythecii]GLS43619.1 hemolysin D [Methylobacterium brachythecii]
MAQSLFSQSWYRVASLRPRLRRHAEIHRQSFRGEIWYVLQDHQTGRFHRLSPSANRIVCLMDGRRTLQEIWELASRRNEDDPPTQDDTIRLISQLHGSDLLQGDLPPDLAELAERSETTARRTLMARVKNPLALRFPLFDPDAALDRLAPLYRPLFTVWGLAVWLAFVVTGLVVAGLHWNELTGDVANQMLSAQNVALLMCLYPIIKALHEAGHACAAKAWGGEVHEVGVMILVLFPAPYVDASSSAAFPSKWQRMMVAAAGICVELFLAAGAAIVWAMAEPGLVRAAAFNVMVIGSVSTLLFNGNPLLRFDGYYIFSDLIEIPNLASRANRYVFHLIERYALKIEQSENPVTAPGEGRWMLFYAVSAFFYRTVVSIAIASFIATQFFIFGIALAVLAMTGIVITPLVKGLKFIAASPKLNGRRRRAVLVTGGAALAVLVALFIIPLPYATMAQGVVWAPDDTQLRAQTDGIVTALLVPPGQDTTAKEPLATLEDPSLDGRVAVLEAQLTELRLRYDAARLGDRVQAQILHEQVVSTQEILRVYRERQAALVVRADHPGRLIVPNATDLPGRYLRRGERIGYVLAPDDPVVRVVVNQTDVDLIRSRTLTVAARLAERPENVRVATIKREVPAAQQDIPSMALSTQGGGTIAVDSSNTQKPVALQSIFIFDVQLAGGIPFNVLGERVYVRFDHGSEAIAWRLLRGLRQVFLSQFRV